VGNFCVDFHRIQSDLVLVDAALDLVSLFAVEYADDEKRATSFQIREKINDAFKNHNL